VKYREWNSCRELCETAELIEMPFGMLSRVDPKNHVLDGSRGPAWKWASLRGKGMLRHARRHSYVNCAKMAEPIEMPFGTWTRVGPRKHVLYVAQIPHAKGQLLRTEEHAIKNMHGHARRHSAARCAKMAEPIDLPFGLWTRVGRRNHKFNRIRQCAVTGGNIGKTWRIRLNRQSSAAMRPYVKLL